VLQCNSFFYTETVVTFRHSDSSFYLLTSKKAIRTVYVRHTVWNSPPAIIHAGLNKH